MHDIKNKSLLTKEWKIFLIRKHNKKELFFTVILLAAILLTFTRFLHYVELRSGITFIDPMLDLFNPVKLNWLIFGLLYIGLIIAVFFFIKDPHLLLTAIQSYIILVLFRIVAMFLMPLNPPSDMLPLNDPFVQMFGTGEILKKDLFFSGHTSTLFLIFIIAKERTQKSLFLFLSLFVGISVLLQHVHYSIDVFTAPFFAFAAVKSAVYIKKRYQGKYS
ncbi:MAG: phosphatase PAP2-related protein [Ignavibacteriaceae bacterium]|nr:phosphatase PAP2-related protein [Ignavibacteriaceae bacterium]